MPEKTKPTTESKPAPARTTTPAPAEPLTKESQGKKTAPTADSEQESGGALTFDAVVDSVVPTGSDRDTFTVVLRPDENDHKFFRRAAGRLELIDVRPEMANQLQGKARATVTIAVTA